MKDFRGKAEGRSEISYNNINKIWLLELPENLYTTSKPLPATRWSIFSGLMCALIDSYRVTLV